VGREVIQRQPSFLTGQCNLRALLVLVFSSLLVLSAACTSHSPDPNRQKTAEQTAAIKRNSKAVAQGVKDGPGNKKSVDLNKASKGDLTSLAGIDTHRAARTIAERQIQDRVVVPR
jgi:DNA uptake protein ComE-like DNA-binding protein